MRRQHSPGPRGRRPARPRQGSAPTVPHLRRLRQRPPGGRGGLGSASRRCGAGCVRRGVQGCSSPCVLESTGAPWRGLPERQGPGKTVWCRFDPWRREGRLDRVKQRLLAHLNEAGELDWDLWWVDGTSIRAARCANGGRKGGGA
ncbi:MAG: transposase [Planctomycetota bacterium]|nr:MAG: transposase [Planctomycetota bacterium]